METLKAIYSRRSVRKYTNQEVSKELITELLEAATWAPSSTNLQPWYFVAITNESDKKFILEVMQKVALSMKAELEERFKAYPQVVAQTLSFTKSLGQASVYILVFEQCDYGEIKQNAITQSIAAAMQNFCLAAASKELGTCWMCAPVNAGFGVEFREKFAPNKGKMVAMLTLGYPNEAPNAPKRKDDRYKII